MTSLEYKTDYCSRQGIQKIIRLSCKSGGLDVMTCLRHVRHPERTTAQREVVKDPVIYVSRSDSAYKYIK